MTGRTGDRTDRARDRDIAAPRIRVIARADGNVGARVQCRLERRVVDMRSGIRSGKGRASGNVSVGGIDRDIRWIEQPGTRIAICSRGAHDSTHAICIAQVQIGVA